MNAQEHKKNKHIFRNNKARKRKFAAKSIGAGNEYSLHGHAFSIASTYFFGIILGDGFDRVRNVDKNSIFLIVPDQGRDDGRVAIGHFCR